MRGIDSMARVLASVIMVTSGVCFATLGVAQAADPPPRVFVAEVSKATFFDRMEALGTLRANESVTLTSPITETISAIYFDDGDRVKAGQMLVELTSAEEHAQLEEARAQQEEAKLQYDRVKSLAAQGTAAQSLVDERRREWETARARITAIESRLGDRLVRAPFAGVVGLRMVSVGALVEPADVITTLDDDGVMKLEFPVPSRYLSLLRSGLEIAASTPVYPDRRFSGRVKSIDSRVDPVTRSVLVRALIPNADRALKPGVLMYVELRGEARQSIVVPEGAVMPQGREHFVFVVKGADGNKVERRKIEVGAREPGKVEVVAGLKEGEQVIADGTMKVRPGMVVEVAAVDDGEKPLADLLGEKSKTGNVP